jgi:hypothetical protein
MPMAGCTRRSRRKRISKWERESTFRSSSVVKEELSLYVLVAPSMYVSSYTTMSFHYTMLTPCPTCEKSLLLSCMRWKVLAGAHHRLPEPGERYYSRLFSRRQDERNLI